MKFVNSYVKEDFIWLRWRLGLLLIALAIAVGMYVSAFIFRNEMRRLESGVQINTEVLQQELLDIEESERIIIENIDRFNAIVADSVMDEENRVALLEDISQIRQRHNFFPLNIEIAEQERQLLNYDESVEIAEEQITLRSSQIQVSLPLLHEGDLSNFFIDFLNTGRLLVANRCSITMTLQDPEAYLDVVEHQRANCGFYWFTLNREPFTGF